MVERVRTRFGPSPTGALHIGGFRTALFNYLYARGKGGEFVLRFEDTDLSRSSPESEEGIIEDLRWLALDWDEGPDVGGGRGPYRQSERLGIYRAHAERLIEAGLAYKCYCSKERLLELKEAQTRARRPPRYDGRCRDLKEAPVEGSPVVRFRVEDTDVGFIDSVHGPMVFSTSAFGDFVIIASDSTASYNFACAVDDALMGITHVIRGDDHLSNTPRQILIMEALGLSSPSYAHLPLILGPDRLPLGKRHAEAGIRGLKEKGFLPEAVLNAAARLGWSPREGFHSLKEMSQIFDLDGLSKSPSIFDTDRLRAFNKDTIARMSPDELISYIGISPKEPGWADISCAIEAVKGSAATLREIEALSRPLLGYFEPTGAASAILATDYSNKVIKEFKKEVEKVDRLTENTYNKVIENTKVRTGEKGKRLFLPIRCALTGRTDGIELVRVAKLIGKENVLERLRLIQG